MGNTAPEREVIYDAMSRELADEAKKLTSQAYQLAVACSRDGLLGPQDRYQLDRKIADASRSIYGRYVAREKEMLVSMRGEIARLRHEIAKAKRSGNCGKHGTGAPLPDGLACMDEIEQLSERLAGLVIQQQQSPRDGASVTAPPAGTLPSNFLTQ